MGRPTCTCRINWNSVDLGLFVARYLEHCYNNDLQSDMSFHQEWSPSHHSKHQKKKLSQQLEMSPSGIAANVLDPNKTDHTPTQVEVFPLTPHCLLGYY